jgi:hypothetical protein
MRVGEGIKGGEDEIGVRYFQSKVYGRCSANAFIQDLVRSKKLQHRRSRLNEAKRVLLLERKPQPLNSSKPPHLRRAMAIGAGRSTNLHRRTAKTLTTGLWSGGINRAKPRSHRAASAR